MIITNPWIVGLIATAILFSIFMTIRRDLMLANLIAKITRLADLLAGAADVEANLRAERDAALATRDAALVRVAELEAEIAQVPQAEAAIDALIAKFEQPAV